MENTKLCVKCKEEKLVTEFHKDKSSKDGHAKRCKKCVSRGGKNGHPIIEMIGKKFGRLLVLSLGGNRSHGGGQARWNCICECGNNISVAGSNLRSGSTKSCGCFRRDRAG